MLLPYRACVAIATIALGGCANLNSIHHEFSTPSPNGGAQSRAIAVDAKQRFLELRLDPTETWWVMCAEPSPDALAAYSASFAGNAAVQLPTGASTKEIAAAVAGAFAEQAAAFGLRTQSITLLRDNAFRLCEGLLNRGLDARQFAILHRRLQNVTIATLAIEQLTGYARPTVTAIGGSASASAAGRVQQALNDLDKARKLKASKDEAADMAHSDAERAKTEGEKAKKTAEEDAAAAATAATMAEKDAAALKSAQANVEKLPASATSEQKKAAEDARDKAKSKSEASDAAKKQADIKAASSAEAKKKADAAATKANSSIATADKEAVEAKDSVKVAEEAYEAAKGLAADAIGTAAQFSVPAAPPTITKEVAQSVSAIVALAIDRDYTKDTCLDYLVTPRKTTGALDSEVRDVCIDLMKAITERVRQETANIQKAIESKPASPASAVPGSMRLNIQ